LEVSLQQEEQFPNNNIKGCILPWNHIFGSITGKFHLCCHAEWETPPLVVGDSTQSLSKIWNNEPLKKVRKQFLNDEVPLVCKNVCYDREALGVNSNRLSVNSRFKNQKFLQDNTLADGSLTTLPTYLDLRFGNLCNFKCRMCGPDASTSWYRDSNSSYSKTIDHYTNNDIIWEDIPNIIPNLTDIYFAGGEPFIQDGHYKLLQLLIDSPYAKNINLQYNSNLSYNKFKKFNLLEMWKNFKDVSIWPSIEGYKSHAEYSRKGLNWNTFENNVTHFRKHIKTFSSVINIFSISSMPELILWFKKQRIDYYGTILMHPSYYSVTCLPKESKSFINNKYRRFLQKYRIFNKYDIKQIKDWLVFMNSRDDSHLLPEFKKEQIRLDLLRNESFESTFPEYESWYKNI
tara:strand:+ start:2452 stop:3657 length:1206 start_codon:yes stop_codon:yes gene_type:complete